MQDATNAGERLVYAVLAAQVSAIPDRVDTEAAVDLMWRMADLMRLLSGLVVELSQRDPVPDAGLVDRCTAAVSEEHDLSQSLDSIAFLHAQGHDIARQMADCVVTALERLVVGESTDGASRGGGLSPDDLVALYVCEEQREVHAAVTKQFGVDAVQRSPEAIAADGPKQKPTGI